MSKIIKQNNNTNIDEELLELPQQLVEDLICKQLLNPQHIENSIFVRQHFLSDWFQDKNLIALYTLLLNYWKKYNAAPAKQLIQKILENDKLKDKKDQLINVVNRLYEINELDYDSKFIQDTLIAFTKRTCHILCYFR